MGKIILLASALITLGFFGVAYAEDPNVQEPVMGAACNSPDAFQYNTERKQPWGLKSLLPVPENYLPSDWPDRDRFLAEVKQRLSSSGSLASSTLELWQQSYISPANMYARFERTVSTERRQVRCISGTWQIVDGSQETAEVIDDSGWVRISDELSYSNSLTAESLSELIENKLAGFNSQPGAATEPFDFYLKIPES